jgi:hypothetical protein
MRTRTRSIQTWKMDRGLWTLRILRDSREFRDLRDYRDVRETWHP